MKIEKVKLLNAWKLLRRYSLNYLPRPSLKLFRSRAILVDGWSGSGKTSSLSLIRKVIQQLYFANKHRAQVPQADNF